MAILNSTVNGFVFHDEYINNSPESRFGVRANRIDEHGNMVSPFFSTNQTWSKEAKSVEQVMPADGVTVENCCGLYLVDYERFKNTGSIYFLRNKDVAYMLVEYSPDDVIMEQQYELVVSQMNIVHVEKGYKFLDEMEDGTIEKIMSDFIHEKQFMPVRSFAAPILRYGYKLRRFYSLYDVETMVALRGIGCGSSLVHRAGKGDLLILNWYIAIMSSGVFHGPAGQNVLSFLLSIREYYLNDLDAEQFNMLYICLTKRFDSRKKNDSEENIYHDSFLLGYQSATGNNTEILLTTRLAKDFLEEHMRFSM